MNTVSKEVNNKKNSDFGFVDGFDSENEVELTEALEPTEKPEDGLNDFGDEGGFEMKPTKKTGGEDWNDEDNII